MIAIDSKGDIYPCPLIMEEAFRIGNINKMSMTRAILSPKVKEIKKMCLQRKSKIPECNDCAWKHFCQAGCPGSIYHSKGDFFKKDDLCKLRHSLYTQTIFSLSDFVSS